MRSPLSQCQIPAAPFGVVGFFGSGRPAMDQADRPAYFGLVDYVRQPILSANVIFRISLGTGEVNYSRMVHFPNWERMQGAPLHAFWPLSITGWIPSLLLLRLAAFEGSCDLVSIRERERLHFAIGHDGYSLALRTYFSNHRDRSAYGLNGLADGVHSVWSDGDQQCARRKQFQRIEPERITDRVGFGK